MSIRDIFKVSRKTFFNPTAWIDYEGLVNTNKIIFTQLKRVFTRPVAGTTETFEQALERQGMNEADVAQLISRYSLFTLCFFVCGVLVFVYAFYLLFSHHSFFQWALALAVAALFFSQAFRYDFWALQMKKRRLGLSFDEWKKHWLSSENKAK